MNNNDEFRELLEQERRNKENKREYDKKYLNMKLSEKTDHKIEKIKQYIRDKSGEKVSKSYVISMIADFYLDTVLNAGLTQEEVKEKYFSNKEANHLVYKFDEQNKVMLHLLLGIFQNIGLQKIGEVGSPITEFVDNLSENNESTKLLEYIQGLVHDEEHSDKLKRG